MKRREARQGAHASEWMESTADFLRQMGYREYARYLSFHFPFTHERSLLEHVRAGPWRYDQSLFKVLPCQRLWLLSCTWYHCGAVHALEAWAALMSLHGRKSEAR